MTIKNRIVAVLSFIAVAISGGYGAYEYADHPQVMGLLGKNKPHDHDARGDSRDNSAGENTDFQYTARSVTYPTYPYAVPYVYPTIGDGSTANGGTPPAFAKMPPVPPRNYDLNKFIITYTDSPPYDAYEAKFRTFCNVSHHAYEDPIVYPGQLNASHLHSFFGNNKMNASSTYESLRTTGQSTCGGGLINRSGYWYPAVLKDNATGDGKTKIITPVYAIIYYVIPTATTSRYTRIPRGLNYVFGFNMSDPTNTLQQNEVEAANIAGGRAATNGYAKLTNGFAGWKCESNVGGLVPYLRDGSGNATLNCATTENIGAVLKGPSCWDGHNLTSPNGRGHVRNFVSNGNGKQDVCPEGWWQIPEFELIIWFNHDGPDDFKNWYLSSDRMPGNSYPGGPCASYNATNGITNDFCNGQTMHSDWFGAWDEEILITWLRHCNGIVIDDVPGDPHGCSETSFGDGRKGVANPETSGSRFRGNDNEYVDLPLTGP